MTRHAIEYFLLFKLFCAFIDQTLVIMLTKKKNMCVQRCNFFQFLSYLGHLLLVEYVREMCIFELFLLACGWSPSRKCVWVEKLIWVPFVSCIFTLVFTLRAQCEKARKGDSMSLKCFCIYTLILAMEALLSLQKPLTGNLTIPRIPKIFFATFFLFGP